MENLFELIKPAYIWLIIGFILLLMEMAAPGILFVSFSMGAIAVGVLCFVLPLMPGLQIVLFLIISVMSLVLLRKRFRSIFMGRLKGGKEMDDLSEGFIGGKAVVTRAISPEMEGQVELHGTLWKAEADTAIPKGTPVIVTEKDNLTLKVEKS